MASDGEEIAGCLATAGCIVIVLFGSLTALVILVRIVKWAWTC